MIQGTIIISLAKVVNCLLFKSIKCLLVSLIGWSAASLTRSSRGGCRSHKPIFIVCKVDLLAIIVQSAQIAIINISLI